MYDKNFFKKGTPREKIIKAINQVGFNPILITDRPGFVYEIHTHPETKLIVCLEGSMKVKVADQTFNFEPGVKIRIAGNTPHSGVVGNKGCTYFWSEKIL